MRGAAVCRAGEKRKPASQLTACAMRRLAVLIVLGCFVACRKPAAPTEPRVARVRATSASELLPDDLDFVVRIDAARVRQNPALGTVVHNLAQGQPSELFASMQAAFGEASALWIGTRWMSDGFHGDGVVAIDLPPATPKLALAQPASANWRPLAVGVRDVEVLERPAKGRGDPVLRVVMDDRTLVLATAAEADAVLRVLRASPDENRLEPPARGLVSFAGRWRSSTPLEATTERGALYGLVEGLAGYAGSLEEASDPGGRAAAAIDVEASLTYLSPAAAALAAERARQLSERLTGAGGNLGSLAHSVRLTEIGSALQLRAKVPFAWLADLD